MVNAHWEPLEFSVQVPGQWRRIVDTTLRAPEHVVAVADAPMVGCVGDGRRPVDRRPLDVMPDVMPDVMMPA